MDRDKLICARSTRHSGKTVDMLLEIKNSALDFGKPFVYHSHGNTYVYGDITTEKHRADVAEEALRKVLTQEEVNRIEEKTRTYLYDIKPIYTTIQKRMVNELEKAEERLREKQL